MLLAFFTETELRNIYTKFGYPSVTKLYNLLDKTSYNVDIGTLKTINKFCYYCQVKG